MIETLASLAQAAGHSLPEVRSGLSISDIRPGTEPYEALTLGAPTFTGRPVNPNSAITYTAVYSCIKIIAEAAASCDLTTYRTIDYLRHIPAVDDYRFRLLREEPNPEMSSFQWREFLIASLLTWGNSFNFIDWDQRGRIKAIWPLRPEWVVPLRDWDGRMLYHYLPVFPYAIPVPAGLYRDWQILHIPGLGFDGVIGYSPIQMARQAIGLGLADEERAGRLASNAARPSIALMTNGAVKDPEALRLAWNATYGGMENYGKTAVLPPTISDIKTFTINPRDAQFLEGRAFQIGEIARIYKVPAFMLGDPSGKAATYASSEQADIQFGKHCIRPWTKRIEQKLNITVLGSQDALVCRHDMRELLDGDAQSRAEADGAAVRDGIESRNEVRARRNLNPIEGGDVITVQYQTVPLLSAAAGETVASQGGNPGGPKQLNAA